MKTIITVWIPGFCIAIFSVWLSREENYKIFMNMNLLKFFIMALYFAGIVWLFVKAIKGSYAQIKYEKDKKKTEIAHQAQIKQINENCKNEISKQGDFLLQKYNDKLNSHQKLKLCWGFKWDDKFNPYCVNCETPLTNHPDTRLLTCLHCNNYHIPIRNHETNKDTDILTLKSIVKNMLANNDSAEKSISNEKMVLPIIGDIFDDDIRYEIASNQITMFRPTALTGLIHQTATDTFKANQDKDHDEDLEKTFRIIQKTINEGFSLRKGMFNFLSAYLQAFLDGTYRDLAKELLNSKDSQGNNRLPKNEKFETLVLGINEKVKNLIEEFAICHRSSFKHIESQGQNTDTNSVGYYMREDNEPDKTIKGIQKIVYDHNYFEKTPYIDCIKDLDKPFNSILSIIDKYKDKIATESEIPIDDSEKLRSFLSEITPYRFIKAS